MAWPSVCSSSSSGPSSGDEARGALRRGPSSVRGAGGRRRNEASRPARSPIHAGSPRAPSTLGLRTIHAGSPRVPSTLRLRTPSVRTGLAEFALMTGGLPVLSLITWAPFVGALLIMFTAPHRPQAVRLIAAITTGVSAVLALWLYVAYARRAAGFQFYEKLPLVPPLGINYEVAVDGMSLLMVLLTAIIIFAGVFASWTVASRSQEFYALLLALVTGVFGVFFSLDLFVPFLFYELAVLPMYLLIGNLGSTGEVRPRGIFAWAYRETGVGTKEYAAMKLTLYLLFGSAFILVGIFALYTSSGIGSFSFLHPESVALHRGLQRWGFLALFVRVGLPARRLPPHTWAPRGPPPAPP